MVSESMSLYISVMDTNNVLCVCVHTHVCEKEDSHPVAHFRVTVTVHMLQ